MNKKICLNFGLLLWAALIFCGCGGSGSTGPGVNSGLNDSPGVFPDTPTMSVSGLVIKGPVSSATVEVFEILDQGQEILIGTVKTNAEGKFSGQIKQTTRPLKFKAQGGTYTDEATQKTYTLGQLNAIIPSNQAETTFSVTPLTEIAAKMLQSQPNLNSEAIKTVSSAVASIYGLSDILVMKDTSRYQSVLAGVSELAAKYLTHPDTITELLGQDAKDGKLDGISENGPLILNQQQIASGFATNELAASVESFLISTRNTSGLTLDNGLIQSIKSNDGNLLAGVKLSFEPIALRTSTPTIELKGITSPPSQVVSFYRDKVLVASTVSATDGKFSIPIALNLNTSSFLEIVSASQGLESRASFTVTHDDLPPSITLNPTFPVFFNQTQLNFQFNLSDSSDQSRITTVKSSQGTISLQTGSISLQNLVPGELKLELVITDDINSQTLIYSGIMDNTKPVIPISLPEFANKSLSLNLGLSEQVNNLRYRFYPVSAPNLQYTSLNTNILNLLFDGPNGTYYLDLEGQDLAGNSLACPNFNPISPADQGKCMTNIVYDSIPPQFVSTPAHPILTQNLLLPLEFSLSEISHTVLKASLGSTVYQTSQQILAQTTCHLRFIPTSLSTSLSTSICQMYLPLPATPSDGAWKFEWELTDRAGNPKTYDFTTILDTTAPLPPVAVPQAFETSSTQISIQFSGESNTALYLTSVPITSQFSGNFLTAIPLMENQNNFLSFLLEDRAGNRSTSTQIQILQDNLPPQGTLSFSHNPKPVLSSTDSITFSYQTIQPEPDAFVSISHPTFNLSLASINNSLFQTSLSLSQLSIETLTPVFYLSSQDKLKNQTQTMHVLPVGLDTVAPILNSVSFTAPQTLIRANQSIVTELLFSKPEPNLIASALRLGANSETLAQNLSFTSTDNLRYRMIYTATAQDLDNASLPYRLLINIRDSAGNSLVTSRESQHRIDTTSPEIALISNNRSSPATLGLQEKIEFTVSFFQADPNLQFSSSYAGKILSFTPFASGAYWRAEVTIDETMSPFPGTGVPPQLVLTVTDLAGNPAMLPTSDRIQSVMAIYDNLRPAIAQSSLNYSTTASILRIGDYLELEILPDASKEPLGSTTPLTATVSFLGQDYGFISTPPLFKTTIPILETIPTSFQPSNLQIFLSDPAKNVSTGLSIPVSKTIDTRTSIPQSVGATSLSTSGTAIISHTIQIHLNFNSDSDVFRATANLNPATPSIPLTFVYQGIQNQLSTTFSLPEWNINTGLLHLENLVVQRNSGNPSTAGTYPFFLSIDTTRPQISLISALPSKPLSLGIGDQIVYSIKPQQWETDLNLQFSLNSRALNFLRESTSETLIATYVIAENDLSFYGSLPVTQVQITDRWGNSSEPFNSPTTPVRDIDPVRPVFASLSLAKSSPGTWLKLMDQVTFSLQTSPASTDVTAATALFNGIPLSFGPNLISTYTLLSTHALSLSSPPQLTQIIITDSSGNTSSSTSTTSMTWLLDNLPVSVMTAGVVPSFASTVGIGSSVQFYMDPVTSEISLIVTGVFNSLPLVLTSNAEGSRYSTSITILSTHVHNPSWPQLSLTILDQASNLTSYLSTNFQLGIDTLPPIIQTISTTSISSSLVPTLFKIGDTLTLSVAVSADNTSGGMDPVDRVEAKFGSSPITLNTTNGSQWLGYHTITSLDGSTTSPVQFSNIIAYDKANNASVAASSTDILRAILAKEPVISQLLHSAQDQTVASGEAIVFTIIPETSSLSDVVSVTAVYNTVSLSFTQSSSLSFIATYVHSGSFPDAPITAPQLQARLIDRVGNLGPSLITTNLPYRLKAQPPTVVITHNAATAGILSIYNDKPTTDNQIVFDVQISPPDASAQVNSLYKGFPLNFNTVTSPEPSVYTLKRGTFQVTTLYASNPTPEQLTVNVTDSFGNQANVSTTSVAKGIDVSRPILNQLLFSYAGTGTSTEYIKIGDSIQFTIVATGACLDNSCENDAPASITALYNSQSLTFSSTDRIHWTSSYTLVEGGTNTNLAIPALTGIAARDTAGNLTQSILSTPPITRILDSIAPQIQSVSVLSSSPVTVLTPGNFLQFELIASPRSGQGTSVELQGYATAVYNGQLLTFSENSGTYKSTYTVLTTHADQNLPLQLSGVRFYDRAGNESLNTGSTNALLGGVTLPINVNPPLALSLSSLPSILSTSLKVGDSIQFTLVLSTAEANLSFTSATYNSIPLSFISTDSGTIWKATYTIDTNHPDQSSPLQLSLTATDAAGLSTSISTTDVYSRIDANPPVISSFNFLNPQPESVGVGQRVTFELISQASEMGATVIKYSSGNLVPVTFLGEILHFSSVDGITFRTHYTVQSGSDEAGFYSLDSISLRDEAGNTSPLRSTAAVFKTIDRSIPEPPSLTPSWFVTSSATIQFSVTGQASTSVYLNSLAIGQTNSSGSTTYSTGLNSESAHVYEYFFREPSQNTSLLTTAKVLRTAFSEVQLSSLTIPVTDLNIQKVFASYPGNDTYFIHSRNGLGKISLNPLSYVSLQKGLPNTSLLSFAQHPTSTNILLAAYDTGLFRSTDGGTTWSMVPKANHQNRQVQAVAFDPDSSVRAYAGTTQYLYRSEDSGLNFPFNMNEFGPLTLDANNTNIVDLAVNQQKVFVATKGGVFFTDKTGSFGSWNLKASGNSIPTTTTTNVVKIRLHPSQPNYMGLILQDKTLLITSNLGDETEFVKPVFQSVTVTSPIQDFLVLQSGEFLAASTSALYASNSAGVSWNQTQSLGSDTILALGANIGTTNPILVGSQNLVYNLTQPFSANPQTVSTLFQPKLHSILSLQTSMVLMLTDSLYHYFPTSSVLTPMEAPATEFLSLALKESSQRVYLGTTQGIFSIGMMGGSTISHSLPLQTPSTEVVQIHFAPAINNLVLVGTKTHGLFRSTDGGISFTTALPALGATTITGLTSLNSEVYAATSTGLYRSLDNAQNFALMVTQASISSLIAATQTTQAIFAVINEKGYLYYPGAPSFTLITQNLDASIQKLQILEGSGGLRIYAMTNQGIYYSQNMGTTWLETPGNIKTLAKDIGFLPLGTEVLDLYSSSDSGLLYQRSMRP
ncbi:MAG: hypothetical protein H3C47_06780 [Candidatus Cloacimonetes bacterium]|nr:hypothetical protein [Candidatus Cloacimonadota bacterium]